MTRLLVSSNFLNHVCFTYRLDIWCQARFWRFRNLLNWHVIYIHIFLVEFTRAKKRYQIFDVKKEGFFFPWPKIFFFAMRNKNSCCKKKNLVARKKILLQQKKERKKKKILAARKKLFCHHTKETFPWKQKSFPREKCSFLIVAGHTPRLLHNNPHNSPKQNPLALPRRCVIWSTSSLPRPIFF